MTVDGIPSVRVCTTPLREGAVVKGQNYVGSLQHDLMQMTDKLGGPFTPPGFYYKTFIRPRKLWPLYEKFLRGAAGLGPLDPNGSRQERVDVEHRHVDVAVIGGGQAGLQAAIAAAQGGESVVVIDEGHDVGGSLLADRDGIGTAAALRQHAVDAGVELLAPAIAIGLFEQGLVPVAYGNLLLKFRAHRVVVATGIVEQPLVFPGNDLIGVMLPDAVRRLVNGFSIKPAERAVRAHRRRPWPAGSRRPRGGGRRDRPRGRLPRGQPAGDRGDRKGRQGGTGLDRRLPRLRRPRGDGRQPSAQLQAARPGGRPRRIRRGSRRLRTHRSAGEGVEAVGAVTGDVGEPAVPSPILDHRGDKCFVCFCEDQTTKDLKYAIAEGFDSIELSKRYTTVTMGPCQGRLCHTNSIRVYAKTTGIDENTIGTTTARPPSTPISMGLLAGPPQEPRKRTSLHHRNKDMGGTMMWAGAWRRPHSYGPDAGAEAQHVHRALGLIDVSTLGKILVSGPDAGAFLDRVYPNRFSDLKIGRTRYGVLTGDAGRIMDDGVVARIDEETFYVSATSTGADGVYQWFTWWNAVWFMDVQFANLTGALAAINVAGPNARAAMQRVSDDDFSAEGFAYLDAKHVTVAGVPTLALRIGFVGELGYELHFPSPLAEHVWDSIFERAADLDPKPFGLEPQRILRLEKGHVIVSQDTDSESNLHEAAMPWLVKNDKEFEWVGKWATQQVADRGLKWMLVGFESPTGAIPVEGGQVVVEGKSAGRVTSVRRSAELDKVIGLAIVPNELAVDGGRFDVQVNGRPVPMTVHLGPFYDPAGEKVKS